MALGELRGVVREPAGRVRWRGLSGVGKAEKLEGRAMRRTEESGSRERVLALY